MSALNLLFVSEESRWANFTTKWTQLIFVSVMFFAISSIHLSQFQMTKLLRIWLIIALLVAGYGIYQSFARNLGLPGGNIRGLRIATGTVSGYSRVSSVFLEPSYLASYLLSPIMLLATLLTKGTSEQVFFQKRIYNVVALGLLVLSLLVAGSAAGYVSMLAMLIIVFLHEPDRAIRIWIIGLVILGVAVCAGSWLGINVIPFFQRAGRAVSQLVAYLFQGEGLTKQAGSAGTRLTRIAAAFHIALKHPLLGVGMGNIPFYDYSAPSWAWKENTTAGTHNVPIRIFAETGFVGLFALILFALNSLRAIRRALHRYKHSGWRVVLLAFYYILWANIINCNFTHAIVHPRRWLDWALAFLLINQLQYWNMISPKVEGKNLGI
jgi:O-antigen ligase